jgi:hypothetical protein
MAVEIENGRQRWDFGQTSLLPSFSLWIIQDTVAQIFGADAQISGATSLDARS